MALALSRISLFPHSSLERHSERNYIRIYSDADQGPVAKAAVLSLIDQQHSVRRPLLCSCFLKMGLGGERERERELSLYNCELAKLIFSTYIKKNQNLTYSIKPGIKLASHHHHHRFFQLELTFRPCRGLSLSLRADKAFLVRVVCLSRKKQ